MVRGFSAGEMDSNHRSLSRGSRFILRKVNCGGIDGAAKKFCGYRWFESISLQRRVCCEPDQLRLLDVTRPEQPWLRDLDRLQEATIAKDGKRITTRTAVAGQVGSVFQAAGIALPPNLHERAA